MMTTVHPVPEQKEKVRHGEAVFPIQKYSTRLRAEYPAVTPHWHEEAELMLITSGSAICSVQLESCTVSAGDLVFISPQLLHAVIKETETMESETFVFHMNLLGGGSGDVCTLRYLAPITNQSLVPPTVISSGHPAYDEARRLFDELQKLWKEKQPGYELMVKATLLSFLALLLPHCSRNSETSAMRTENAEKIKTALEYMEAHYGEELSIADVASACYFSQYHFMRFFKKHVGISCGEYLKNLRLEKAGQRFAAGQRNILDVATESGFRNLSYFYREFQKKYGMTPKQFIHRAE